MSAILSLQVMIFALIAVGFLVRRIGIVGPEGQKNLTDLVLYLFLPCNILTAFLTGADREKVVSYASIFVISIVYLTPFRIAMWSAGISIFAGTGDRKATIRRVVTHPCIIACTIGVVLMLTGFTVPAVIAAPIRTLGQCNTACSMMVVGMILTRVDPHSFKDPGVYWFTLHRLVLMPVIVYLACLLLPVSKTVTGVSVLLAAMPAGATTTMLSAKYNRDPKFATQLVVFTTLCSIPAIFIWSMLLTG